MIKDIKDQLQERLTERLPDILDSLVDMAVGEKEVAEFAGRSITTYRRLPDIKAIQTILAYLIGDIDKSKTKQAQSLVVWLQQAITSSDVNLRIDKPRYVGKDKLPSGRKKRAKLELPAPISDTNEQNQSTSQ